ncbi:MAG: hypothetical protein ABI416_10850 [Ginsengibacter sp.]
MSYKENIVRIKVVNNAPEEVSKEVVFVEGATVSLYADRITCGQRCGIIGSGAIESAHRTVIQKRMKLSGQRWSKCGAQNILKSEGCKQKTTMVQNN